MADDLEEFPEDWQRCLVIVAHPDDPEYGLAAAVNRWTGEGKQVDYLLASSGEAGIEGMPPEQCGPVREEEQRRSAGVVGVEKVDFLGFPDSAIRNTVELRKAISAEIAQREPDIVLTLYRGLEWGPEAPNQSDHIELGNAVVEAIRDGDHDVRVFENGPEASNRIAVGPADVDAAIESLAQHEQYLTVLDPQTPVAEQARKQIDMMVQADADGRSYVRLNQIDPRG